MSNDSKLKAGDRAMFRDSFGAGRAVACTIIDVGEKNGQLVYDCRLANGDERWGYADQFTKA